MDISKDGKYIVTCGVLKTKKSDESVQNERPSTKFSLSELFQYPLSFNQRLHDRISNTSNQSATSLSLGQNPISIPIPNSNPNPDLSMNLNQFINLSSQHILPRPSQTSSVLFSTQYIPPTNALNYSSEDVVTADNDINVSSGMDYSQVPLELERDSPKRDLSTMINESNSFNFDNHATDNVDMNGLNWMHERSERRRIDRDIEIQADEIQSLNLPPPSFSNETSYLRENPPNINNFSELPIAQNGFNLSSPPVDARIMHLSKREGYMTPGNSTIEVSSSSRSYFIPVDNSTNMASLVQNNSQQESNNTSDESLLSSWLNIPTIGTTNNIHSYLNNGSDRFQNIIGNNNGTSLSMSRSTNDNLHERLLMNNSNICIPAFEQFSHLSRQENKLSKLYHDKEYLLLYELIFYSDLSKIEVDSISFKSAPWNNALNRDSMCSSSNNLVHDSSYDLIHDQFTFGKDNKYEDLMSSTIDDSDSLNDVYANHNSNIRFIGENRNMIPLSRSDLPAIIPKLSKMKPLTSHLMKAIVSTKFSPTSNFLLVGYGVRNSESFVVDHVNPCVSCEIVDVRSKHLESVSIIQDVADEVNVSLVS